MKLIVAAVALLILSWAAGAQAACICRCVNGEVTALCSSSIDIEPVCAPRVCPIVPPSIAPIQSPRVPPIGTESCRQAQVYNPQTYRYEWREVCR